MTISTLQELRDAYAAAGRISAQKTGGALANFGGNVNIHLSHIWDYFRVATGYPGAGATPAISGGQLYTKATTGAIALPGTVAGTNYLLADVQASAYWSPVSQGALGQTFAGSGEYYVHVYDRVWANSGINPASTSLQSWSPPALTRYATGEGLSLWMCWIASFNVANSNVTIGYVNSDGVSQSLTFAWNALAGFAYHNPLMMAMPLVAGDRGIRSISSIQFGSPSGAGGNLGMMIAKYLGCYRVSVSTEATNSAPTSLFSGLPSFDGNACLSLAIQVPGPVATYAAGTMPQVAFEARVVQA